MRVKPAMTISVLSCQTPAVVMPDSDPASRECRRHWIAGQARNDNFCVVIPDLIRRPGNTEGAMRDLAAVVMVPVWRCAYTGYLLGT